MRAPIRRTRGCAGSGILALLLAAALLSTSGCSFIFVQSPPAHPVPSERLTCTTSYAAPTIDTVLGILHLVSIGIVASSSGDSYGGSSGRELFVRSDAIWAGVELGAAIYGFNKVGRCNELASSMPYRPRRTRGPGEPGIEPTPPWREPSDVPPPPGREPGIEPGVPRVQPIEPPKPGREPGIEPPRPGEEPAIEPPPRKPSIEPTPGREPGIEPAAQPPAPPARRVRQQMDGE